MSPTITRVGQFHDSSHSHIRKIGAYTGPASYETGGDSFRPSDLGLGTIELLIFTPAYNAALNETRFLTYDYVNHKVLWSGTLSLYSESTADVDFSQFTARFEAIGR